ncbi:hypothetical protein ACWD3J_13390 [Streptomyces sp. NPDC002755]|uniref:hypothetical protein n=1 Tax=Streptomyces sp. NPDC002884 TaxID=3154544 RepID=UPI00332FE4FD
MKGQAGWARRPSLVQLLRHAPCHEVRCVHGTAIADRVGLAGWLPLAIIPISTVMVIGMMAYLTVPIVTPTALLACSISPGEMSSSLAPT